MVGTRWIGTQNRWKGVKGKSMGPSDELGRTHLRVARPTDDLDAVVRFYRDGLGFDVLYQFRDHDGFDGVMLGPRGRTTYSSPARSGTRPAGPGPRTICPSSTCRARLNGPRS